MTRFQEEMLATIVAEADEAGYRLEIVNGLGVWEFQPNLRHYKTTRRIASSVRDSSCFVAEGVYVRFQDGSLKRPDVSIFCREPDELDEAVTLLPEAVVEVVSRGSEAKDLELNPAFYLRVGVKDVLIVDPYTGLAFHHRRDGPKRLTTPVEVSLECGCQLTL